MKLVTKYVAKAAVAAEVESTTNRIVIVDCSGSMYSELPKLRTQLKNKLPTLVKPNDSLTLIWFSGKNEFGVIFEDIEISSVKDLTGINQAIDRFLTAQGLTGFTQPLQEVKRVIKDSTKDSATLCFMSDGGDNQGTRQEILEICAELAPLVASSVMVSYGYYADDAFLGQMADSMTGSVVLAEDFSKYTEILSGTMKGSFGKKVQVTVNDTLSSDFAFVLGAGQSTPVIGVLKNSEVAFPSDLVAYSYLTGTGDSIEIDQKDAQAACYMVGALIQRGMPDTALQLASTIGDVVLYKAIENAFSKQDYARAIEIANQFGSGARVLYSVGGKQENLIPDANAYNVLTLLMDLADTEGNFLDISHPEFQYKAISAARHTAPVNEAGFIPKFTDKATQVLGAISALKFDEDRPNVSVLVKRNGSVNLPENDFGFGDSFDTFIWRSYSVITDGIVNVPKLPVTLTKASFDLMVQNGVFDASETYKVGKTYVIDTTRFPVINRAMANPIELEDLFRVKFELYKLEAEQKVIGAAFEKPEAGAKFVATYGEDAAKFLKEVGITEGGFNPKSTKGESADPRVAKIAEIKMSGLSSIPKVEDVQKAISAGKKLTPSQTVVSWALQNTGKSTEEELKEIRTKVRAARSELVMTKFGIILGKKLPVGMKDLDDNTREMDFGVGKPVTCQFVLTDKEI